MSWTIHPRDSCQLGDRVICSEAREAGRLPQGAKRRAHRANEVSESHEREALAPLRPSAPRRTARALATRATGPPRAATATCRGRTMAAGACV